jgi:hypothetical protein
MAVNVPETLVDAVFSACGSTEALGEVRVASIRTVRYRLVTEIQRVWLGKTGV